MEEEEAVTDTFIRAVAAEIKGQDSSYADSLREREKYNPKFAFLLRKDVSRVSFFPFFHNLIVTSTADMHSIVV